MGLFRSYATFKIGKKVFDQARRYWKKRQRSKAKSRLRR